MCDVCMSPGHCCQLIALSGSNPDPTKQPQQPMSFEAAEHSFALNEFRAEFMAELEEHNRQLKNRKAH